MNINEECLLKFLYNTKESVLQKEEEAFNYKKFDETAFVRFYRV